IAQALYRSPEATQQGLTVPGLGVFRLVQHDADALELHPGLIGVGSARMHDAIYVALGVKAHPKVLANETEQRLTLV
ncbi:hypothetical protein, partial [Pseudomonas sp. MD332_6]|uniref:hypothetical protein n=1 Tax=Pseudomonas sp. MD332_6 TaxID=3241256 RepID=UPI0036D3D5EA